MPILQDKTRSTVPRSPLHDDVLVDMPYFDKLGAHVAQRIYDAVATERTVVREVVEIAAIREEALATAGLRIDAPHVLPYRLVHPVPDAAADERRIGVDDIPVLL